MRSVRFPQNYIKRLANLALRRVISPMAVLANSRCSGPSLMRRMQLRQ